MNQRGDLSQSSGELAASEVGGGGSSQRDTVAELVQGHVLLNVLRKLNPNQTSPIRNYKHYL